MISKSSDGTVGMKYEKMGMVMGIRRNYFIKPTTTSA